MIYLALQISIYLLAALALGVAAGWLWRHRDAAAEQQALERRLIDSGHRLPSMEAALRDRDARIAGLEQSLAERNDVIDRALGERDLVLEEALAQRDTAKAELAKLLADASQQGQDQADRDERLARAEAEAAALRERLQQLTQTLTVAERRVEELGRERALQVRALAAMEQQLELARERLPRAASG
jgi:chromosome segregation ATPase